MKYDHENFPIDDAEAQERRDGSRTTSVYRPVLIEFEGFAGFCLIRNLSPGGMMGQVYTEFTPELSVTVHISPEIIVNGQIVWSKDQRIGVQFEREIDVEEVLKELGSKYIGSKLNRAPRLQIQCSGELRIGNESIAMELQDISQRGTKVAVPHLKAGEEVVVLLDGLDPHKALVRWSQRGTAGLNFVRPLGFEELARWAIGRYSK